MFKKRRFVAFTILLLSLAWVSGCRSLGISVEDDARLSPSSPSQVNAEIKENRIFLSWLGTGNDRIQYYQIYRKAPEEDWQRIAQVKTEGGNRDTYEFLDQSSEKGNTYIYGVAAVSDRGKESSITESPPIVAP